MKNKLAWLAVIGASLVFGGCGTTGQQADSSNQGGAVVQEPKNTGDDASTRGALHNPAPDMRNLDDPNSDVYNKTVYFDFDQSNIRSEFLPLLRAHAQYLNNRPSTFVTVEGHCDERGSREYNIGLGERRANAVAAFLQAEGVPPRQIITVSYGEEQPAAEGHNEDAWAQNRRAILAY